MTNPGNRKIMCVGNYRLTGHRLGKGNFAKVEEAMHTILKTKVALKIMNVSEIREEYVVRHLHREARLMARLSHPCIAALYETMQTDGIYYIVAELVGGGDLCSYIKAQRGGRLDERSAKTLGRQLVSAVAYMHGLGIVHRDLKMENIMLNEAKTMLKIVDFGLSNTWEPGTMLRTHCGSPEYAAPELFVTGKLYGPEVDLWSIGVILYGMVMGQLPFLTTRDQRISSHEKRKLLLAQINRGLSTAHRKALSSLSIEFRAMLARLLVPNPSKRIAITDLAYHTWLTEKNRRPLRITGLPAIDNYWKALIIKEISKLLNTNTPEIEYRLETEPHGMIGGIYNIYAHRHMQENLLLKNKESVTQTEPIIQLISKPNIIEEALMDTSTVAKIRMNRTWNADTQGTDSRLRVIGSKGADDSYNLKCTTNKTTYKKTSPKRVKTTNRRTKSEPSTYLSKGNNTLLHSTEKTMKRRSCHSAAHHPADISNIDSCEHSPPTTKSKFTNCSNKKMIADQNKSVEKKTVARPMTCPDYKSITGQSEMSKKLLDQPIARSIAGYMANNIHAQFNKRCKWIKGFTTFNEATRSSSADSPYKCMYAVRR